MQFPSLAGLIGISLAASSPLLLHAQAAPLAKWREIRDHQPAALHLKLSLAKDLFFQGEKIDATLEFSNDDARSPYSLAVGTGTPGVVFHATDDKGNAVVDPLQWRNDWYPGQDSGSLVKIRGHWSRFGVTGQDSGSLVKIRGLQDSGSVKDI